VGFSNPIWYKQTFTVTFSQCTTGQNKGAKHAFFVAVNVGLYPGISWENI
jgi:hypothetical protein